MNKLFNLGAMLTIAAGAMMINSSCSNNDMPTYDPGVEKTAAYQDNFVKTFGNIDPNNDWGFGENIPSNPKPTKAFNTDANNWGLYVEVPDPLTEEQKSAVTAWFAAHQNPQGISAKWSDYFVQQVSSTKYGKNMDFLTGGIGDDADHFNDYNGGDVSSTYVCYGVREGNEDINNRKLYRNDKIRFMVNSSTDFFSYHDSKCQTTYKDKYVIIPGDVIAQEHPGIGLEGMFFVGFDYNAFKFEGSSDNVPADGYYNDWIVKITPGLYTGDQRVMCEDLGATADYDFNDIVFDVKNDLNGYIGGNGAATIIIVRAAGGTLPATIAGKEIHELFGVSTSDMVNTGIKSAPVAIFRIPQVANAKDIEVKVGDDSGTWELKTATGAAPQKICVPSSVKWNKEYKSIKLSYPDFENYVGDANAYPEWYKNVAASNELY